MCGICGYVGDHRPELLEPMCLAMIHRGPDDMGTWHDANARVGLGHRRLSIIDLSPAGHQPMTTQSGDIWITFNGEIYNYLEHRERLIAKGRKFRSQSDTEVLLYMYEEMGADFLNELNGIFAFAIWDARDRSLLLARDHAGIKPLYYRQDGQRLFFASEIKALLQIPGMPRELSMPALNDYLTFLWAPGDTTMLRGINKVEPGHYLRWKDGRTEIRQWFELAYEPDEKPSESEWIDRVHDTFIRTTRRQMVSDVPLGAFLSGGVDSSSIVACMRQSFPARKIDCYTIEFAPGDMVRDQFVDDYPYAKLVADRLGVNLKSILLQPDVIDLLPKLVYHLDEPDADPAVFPSYLISKLAREDGTTVLLSGTGGDEVFFGYRSHQALRQMERMRWLPQSISRPALAAAASLSSTLMGAQSAIPRRLRKFGKMLAANGLARNLALSDWSADSTRSSLYSPQLTQALSATNGSAHSMQKYYDGFRGSGELNRRSHLLIQTFLAAHNFLYTDKSSMAVSLEARVPFMDVELMQLCARIPERYKLHGQTTKYVLKRAMERYLPREVLHRSKTGFGAPLRKWIVEDLDDVIHDLLGPRRVASRGLFNPPAVQQILDQNRANKADHAYLIYALLTLEMWMQTFIDKPGVIIS
jgi:asparagine synthase (glutamine-hydrolysing)